MLHFLDVLLTIVHLGIIGFNLFGWIPRATRKAHLISILLTASSWFLLGMWFGTGYCPFTDWQWRIKEKLGETNLPSNFIEYYADKLTGKEFSPSLINMAIIICFSLAALLSVYLNFSKPRKKARS